MHGFHFALFLKKITLILHLFTLNLNTMAKILPVTPFTNTLGNFSVYKMFGVDKPVVREKHGPTKEQIETQPCYSKLRLCQKEFAGCGKGASLLSLATFAIKPLSDPSYSGMLVKICKIIQLQDSINPMGERSVLFSQYGNILNGFNINRLIPFDNVIQYPVTYTLFRKSSKATIVLPKIHPAINMSNPEQYPLFRFIICLGVITDLVNEGTGYAPVNTLMQQNAVQQQTEWLSTKNIFTGITQEIKLRKSLSLDDNANLLLSLGIEFGRPVSNTVVEAVKRAGCGKILAVG